MPGENLSGSLDGTQFEDIPNFNKEGILEIPEKDIINHPDHYNQGDFEVIDVIEDWELGFNLGNAIKYIARHKAKGNATVDLKKALFYIKREINRDLKSCNLPIDFPNVEKRK